MIFFLKKNLGKKPSEPDHLKTKQNTQPQTFLPLSL